MPKQVYIKDAETQMRQSRARANRMAAKGRVNAARQKLIHHDLVLVPAFMDAVSLSKKSGK